MILVYIWLIAGRRAKENACVNNHIHKSYAVKSQSKPTLITSKYCKTSTIRSGAWSWLYFSLLAASILGWNDSILSHKNAYPALAASIINVTWVLKLLKSMPVIKSVILSPLFWHTPSPPAEMCRKNILVADSSLYFIDLLLHTNLWYGKQNVPC